MNKKEVIPKKFMSNVFKHRRKVQNIVIILLFTRAVIVILEKGGKFG